MKLNLLLADMCKAVAIKRDTVLPGVDEAALRIQRTARVFLARKSFRKNLYKLIIFRNIVENKVHKEKMSMLFGFEQLIINTEEMQELEFLEHEEAQRRAMEGEEAEDGPRPSTIERARTEVKFIDGDHSLPG